LKQSSEPSLQRQYVDCWRRLRGLCRHGHWHHVLVIRVFVEREGEGVWCDSWGHEVGIENKKAPTAVLLDKDEKFVAFGYDAIQRFSDLSKEELDEFSLYQAFKMEL
jgi:hypothetical protein